MGSWPAAMVVPLHQMSEVGPQGTGGLGAAHRMAAAAMHPEVTAANLRMPYGCRRGDLSCSFHQLAELAGGLRR